MESWVEPLIEWRSAADQQARIQDAIAHGELLAQWPPAPTEKAPTDCFRVGREFWIWQPGVGGLQFGAGEPTCLAFPAIDADPAWFAHVVTRSWLPAVYQVWGRQVLHASAVVHLDTGSVIAFAGPSGAGKSTMAYGLSSRQGWRPLADDTLAFSAAADRITLHPLPNSLRLRPASAAHFGVGAGPGSEAIAWPPMPLRLERIYFLDAHEDVRERLTRTPLKAAESYPLLLGQAHAFTLKIAEHNQRLMRDYLQLAALVPIARLAYRRAFVDLASVLDAIANDASLPAG